MISVMVLKTLFHVKMTNSFHQDNKHFFSNEIWNLLFSIVVSNLQTNLNSILVYA